MQKWVSVWGNAVSIAENRPERYAKEITLRYPITLPFSGSGVRLTFDNYCGTEPVTLEKVTIFCGGAFHPVTFGGERRVTLPAEGNAISDTLETPVTAGEKLLVSFYLRDFTLMRSVVFTCGALSGGLYANGDETENLNISMDTSRKTQLTYSSAMCPCVLRRRTAPSSVMATPSPRRIGRMICSSVAAKTALSIPPSSAAPPADRGFCANITA